MVVSLWSSCGACRHFCLALFGSSLQKRVLQFVKKCVRCAKRNLKGFIWGSVGAEELKYAHLKLIICFNEPPIAVSQFLNVAVHRDLKV